MNKRLCKICLLLIIILQITTICHWAGVKANYHIDELYSFGYSQFFNHPRSQFKPITDSNNWPLETWIENNVMKDRLNQSEEENLLSNDPLTVIKKLFLEKYNYFGLLNILRDLFSDGTPSLIPGLILNIIFFICTQVLLFRITEEMTGSQLSALAAVFMYGFSLMAIGMTLFVRFYEMVTFMFMAVLRLHQIMRRKENLLQYELLTILSMIILLTAMRNSQLLFILGGSLIFFFTAGLLFRRQFIRASCYLVTIVPAGLYYILRKTNFMDVLFHPEEFLDTRNTEFFIAGGLTDISFQRILPLVRTYIKWLCYQLFGSKFIFPVFCLLFAVLAGLWVFRKPKDSRDHENGLGFSLIIAGLIITYIIASLLSDLKHERYLCFLFPMAAALLWTWTDLFTKGRSYRRTALAACVILTCAGIIAGQVKNFDQMVYLYHYDRDLYRAVKDSGIDTSIVIYRSKNAYNMRAVYDCVNMLPDTAKLYPIDWDHKSIDVSECPDELLIWYKPTTLKWISRYVRGLIDEGYEITELGRNHTSNVYLARRAKP